MTEPFHIVYLERLSPQALNVVERHLPHGCTFRCLHDGDEAALLARADALIAGHYPIVDDGLLNVAPRLKVVQRQGVGYDTVDTDALVHRGIPLAITAGPGTAEVAEHAVMLMLAVLRDLPRSHEATVGGRWPHVHARTSSRSLRGRRVGIVGAGRIARAVATRVAAFEATCRYWSRGALDRPTERALGLQWMEPDDLFAWADILTLHVPAVPGETMGLIGKQELQLLGNDGILVNTARGSLVDEDALVAALHSGGIAGAGLDVFVDEPLAAASSVASAPNVVLTPHHAGGTADADEKKLAFVLANLDAFRRGRQMENRVV